MTPPANYAPDEEARLRRALREGEPPVCPRCGSGMDRQDVPPRAGVAYVRDRLWLVCRACHRSAVFDRRRLEG